MRKRRGGTFVPHESVKVNTRRSAVPKGFQKKMARALDFLGAHFNHRSPVRGF
jgi:hypothetical protein